MKAYIGTIGIDDTLLKTIEKNLEIFGYQVLTYTDLSKLLLANVNGLLIDLAVIIYKTDKKKSCIKTAQVESNILSNHMIKNLILLQNRPIFLYEELINKTIITVPPLSENLCRSVRHDLDHIANDNKKLSDSRWKESQQDILAILLMRDCLVSKNEVKDIWRKLNNEEDRKDIASELYEKIKNYP